MTSTSSESANRISGSGLIESDLTRRAIGVFFAVYNELGFGFIESIYLRAMLLALAEAGLAVRTQVPIDVHFRGQNVGRFKLDLVVEDRLIVEVKAGRAIDAVHDAQLLNYLRATRIEVGLLLYFGRKPAFKRFVATHPGR